jgi:hypothetical protein
MNAIVQHDVQKLMDDVGEIRQILGMLEEHRSSWVRTQEERDVSLFIGCINKIEADISITVNNFIIHNKKGDRGEAHVIEGMHQAFSSVDSLFHDCKKVRNDLERSFIREDQLKALEIDLARFRKNIIQLLNYMDYKSPGPVTSKN